MAARPPQWGQNAYRDTRIVDPVLNIHEVQRFRGLRPERADATLVLTTPKGSFAAYPPPHRIRRSDIAAHGWTTAYEVDTGRHEDSAALSLPSRVDAFPFEVRMGCTWQVTDPVRCVASGERDVPALVRRAVEGLVRPILRRHDVEDSLAAEEEVWEALTALAPLGAAQGLDVQIAVELSSDADVLAHQRELRQLHKQRELLEPEHLLELHREELEAKRTLARTRQEHEVLSRQEALSHERALQEGRHELERQEIEAKKVEYYAWFLERGGPHAAALELAKRPDDAHTILRNLRDEQIAQMKRQLDTALHSLQNGHLEAHQRAEVTDLALEQLRALFADRTASPGSPAPQVGPSGGIGADGGRGEPDTEGGTGSASADPGQQPPNTPQGGGYDPPPCQYPPGGAR